MEDRPLILESFDMNLPRLSNRSEEVKYHQLSALLTTTQACIPPYLLLLEIPGFHLPFLKWQWTRRQTLSVPLKLNSSSQSTRSFIDAGTVDGPCVESTAPTAQCNLISCMKRSYDFAPEELKEDEKGLMKYGSSATDVENRIDTIKDLAGRTAWVGNATPFVALFNWDHLLLFKFKENDLGRKKRRGMTTAGDTAELTWITEGTAVHNCDRGPYIQTGKFRRAMLGFVVGAFEAKFGR